MREREEERYVRELFEQLYGVQLIKVPETEAKTFDYELRSAEAMVAALEVKRFGEVARTPENGWSPSESGFMTRKDNAAARVGAAIHDAYKQLRETQQSRVLVFVNDDAGMDFLDFREATDGFLVYGVGEDRFKNMTGAKIAKGRIRETKLLIDLYIWINRYHDRVLHRVDGRLLEPHAERGPFFVCTSSAGHDLAVDHFGVLPVPRPAKDLDAELPSLADYLKNEVFKR